MKIMIRNKDALEEIAKAQFIPNTAVISIKSTNGSYPELESNPEYIIRINPEDDNPAAEVGECISVQQAKEIAVFYNDISTKADALICQCEDGKTKSAAIAAAILEVRSKRGIDVFSDDRYLPDKAIFKMVLKQLKALKKES